MSDFKYYFEIWNLSFEINRALFDALAKTFYLFVNSPAEDAGWL
jgi:hypothetical protein